MAASELVRRTEDGDPSGAPELGEVTRALCEEVVELARALPRGLRRLTVRSGDRVIEVEWAPDALPAAEGRLRLAPESVAERQDAGSGAPPPSTPEAPEGTTAVRAPLVGTFYAAPSPGADPFVRVDDEVESGQTLGIVEAMKLMNPILAEAPGVVAEVLIGDAESVEYDQVLMYLRPTGRLS
jgi:acetyl-CoA carboxylase biotin carboxyl carrier protein